MARLITAPLSSIVDTFGGKVLTGELPNDTAEYLLMIGAMSADTFVERMKQRRPEQLVLFVGDREDIQMLAIKARVRAIVVTGDLPVAAAVEEAARAGGVIIVRSPHDTAISVDLARGAVQVARMLEPEAAHVYPGYFARAGAREGGALGGVCFSDSR